MEPNATSMPAEPKKSNGALIGSIIIILILIIGGIYLLSMDKAEEAPVVAPDESLSESDELDSIEADLNAQGNFDTVDQGLE